MCLFQDQPFHYMRIFLEMNKKQQVVLNPIKFLGMIVPIALCHDNSLSLMLICFILCDTFFDLVPYVFLS